MQVCMKIECKFDPLFVNSKNMAYICMVFSLVSRLIGTGEINIQCITLCNKPSVFPLHLSLRLNFLEISQQRGISPSVLTRESLQIGLSHADA